MRRNECMLMFAAAVAVTMNALLDVKGSGAMTSEDLKMSIDYSGVACRDNSATKEWVAEAAKCAGYYTVALAPDDDSVEVDRPHGNGYLTLTVDAKGKENVRKLKMDVTASAPVKFAEELIENPGCPSPKRLAFTFVEPATEATFTTVFSSR